MIAPKLMAGGLTLLVAAALALGAGADALAQGFDVKSVPRPEGAEVAPDREQSSSSVTYVYPASVSNTVAATEKALNGTGWMRYRTPDQENASGLRFKNGRTGIYVSFTMSGGKADRSRIYYSHNNSIPANVPFPEDATDIVYDENRPYLRCVTGMSVDAALEFFTKGLGSEGWSPLATAAIAAQYPNAKLNEPADGGKRLYFNRDRRERQYPPVALTLQRGPDGKTIVDLRIASFALPQELEFYQEYAGLPASKHYKSSGATGSADSPRREARALLIAEIPAVIAFYRREMALRGWSEQQGTASITDTAARVTFIRPDEMAVLELGQRYDLTTVRLNAQISQAAMAARERAKKDADAQWVRNALKEAQELAAASEVKRRERVAIAAASPVETLKPAANSPAPIPMPEDADEVKFDGNRGSLDFYSPSSPKSVAAFYREALKSRGWQEARSVINGPSMFRMDFSRGGQKIGMTVMQMGPKAKISADGNGLEVPPDPNKETVRLEGEDKDGFPVPKGYTMSSPSMVTKTGGGPAFRREFNGAVPADVGSVLAFYRRELGKRSWKEQVDGAVVQPNNVKIAYASPDGPAWLKLGRNGRETTINIVVKNPRAAAEAEALPPAGMSRVVFGNIGETAVSVTINQKTVKVPPGVGKERPPKELMMDLKPGKYRYVVKVAGKRDQAEDITVAADDTWAILIGPGGGVLPLQMY